jgi:hypothetical protein
MSKHHYAIGLARAGNSVYFINHPDRKKELKSGEIRVDPTEIENLQVVNHRLRFPYFIKFKFNRIYQALISIHIKKIVRKIGKRPNVIWSFDTGNTLPLHYFPECDVKIYMPVDGPFGHADEMHPAKKADVIISVTDTILNAYRAIDKPKFQVNHGVADDFLNGRETTAVKNNLAIGYSGSLIRNDLDTQCFLSIIKRHPDKTFEFWGEHDYNKSNIHLPQDVHANTLSFIDTLKSLPNVILHGPVNSYQLAQGLKRMDVLLICYNIRNDQNHHKVLEYLGTGKVIVSNYMSSYANEDPELLVMVKDNAAIAEKFDEVINNLSYYNSADKQTKRKLFASQHSYSNNIRRIEAFINASMETSDT